MNAGDPRPSRTAGIDATFRSPGEVINQDHELIKQLVVVVMIALVVAVNVAVAFTAEIAVIKGGVVARATIPRKSDGRHRFFYRLRLQVVIQTFETAFSAITRLFDTTEWCIYGGKIPVIDRYRSCFYLSCNAKRSRNRASVDAC